MPVNPGGSAGTFRGAQDGVVHPVGDGLPDAFGCGAEQRVFGGGEADAAYLGAGFVAEGWPAGAWAHGVENSGHGKFAEPLARPDFLGHNKYMTTTTAHRVTIGQTVTVHNTQWGSVSGTVTKVNRRTVKVRVNVEQYSVALERTVCHVVTIVADLTFITY